MSKKTKIFTDNLIGRPRITYGTNRGSLPISPPPIPNNFSTATSAELMQLCVYTYDQYTAHQTSESWTIPSPYKIEKVLYSYEKNQQDVSIKVPFGFIVSKTLNTDIYICFRGTRGAQEWEKDATIPLVPLVESFLPDNETIKVKVHKGFQDVYTNPNNVDVELGSLQSQVLDFLKISVPIPNYSNLWVTGHSLGAALATLAVFDIVKNTIHKGAKMYNFASPLVGNQDFVDFFKSKIGTGKCNGNNNINTCSWRVVNTNDLVPKIPPAIFGYAHVNGCSGQSVCNNRIDKNNENNGLFEITFAEQCKNLFKDAVCFGNAHKADTYLSTLEYINNSTNKTLKSFIPTWRYTEGSNSYPLLLNITRVFNGRPFTITLDVSPQDATYQLSGNATVTNVGTAQLTVTGTGNFTGSAVSPSITVTPAQIRATWEWSNGIDFDWLPLEQNITREFNNRPFTIRLIDAFALDGNTRIIAYQTSGYLGSGIGSITNVGTLQLTLTGRGNFMGSATSPSITVNGVN